MAKTEKVSINFCTITVAIILSTRGYGYGNGDQLLSYISTLLVIELGAVVGLLGYRNALTPNIFQVTVGYPR